jgi:L-histidine Nalpha-methyltransferase
MIRWPVCVSCPAVETNHTIDLSSIAKEVGMPIARATSQANDHLEILNCLLEDDRQEDGGEIIAGLTQPQKRLPSKYFYDAYGSWLFDRICELPEYYLTRTELAILAANARAIMAFFAEAGGDLVELGSGSNRKIKLLLDAVPGAARRQLRYVPVDISESALCEASQELLSTYRDLYILGIIADFTRHLEILPPGRKLIIFLGSTIGNFTYSERLTFLRRVAQAMNPEDSFLLGLDMLKPADVIEAAYNDRQGVTAEFNKNILRNLNRWLKADFALADFEHQALFIKEKQRLEMHLRAIRPTAARLAALDLAVSCRRGETIHTETCQKFSRDQAQLDFQLAGLAATRWFTDPAGWFSLVLLQKAPGKEAP